jgi:hypothetical protein
MKIFELESAGVYNLFEPKKGVDLDRSDKWDRRPPSAPVRPASSPAVIAADRRSVNIGAGQKLKLHVLDLGKLRLDKNFMVANTTVATPRAARSSIFPSPPTTSNTPTATSCSIPDAIRTGEVRMGAGQLTVCRNSSLISAVRNACSQPAST